MKKLNILWIKKNKDIIKEFFFFFVILKGKLIKTCQTVDVVGGKGIVWVVFFGVAIS
jgi:hypothetical protein